MNDHYTVFACRQHLGKMEVFGHCQCENGVHLLAPTKRTTIAKHLALGSAPVDTAMTISENISWSEFQNLVFFVATLARAWISRNSPTVWRRWYGFEMRSRISGLQEFKRQISLAEKPPLQERSWSDT